MKSGLRTLFSEVAAAYDLANHVLTLGLDIPWRRSAARAAAAGGGSAWLDVCCGPGEMTRCLASLAPSGTRVIGADFTPAMILASAGRRDFNAARYVAAEADRLPFPNGSFDLVTISFATRNINTSPGQLRARFREFRRVLRSGGTFLNLETSQPSNRFARSVFHAYVGTFVRPVGAVLSGSRAAYAYLSSTISRFYDPERLSEIILEAGFSAVTVRRLCFGAAAVHFARK